MSILGNSHTAYNHSARVHLHPEAPASIDMTSLTPSSAISSMSHLNSTFDPDIDSFLDFDQASFTPSSTSPDLSKGKAVAHNRPSQPTSAASYFASTQSQQTFSGPSFNYDNYRQQTGLPVGGLANTFALNQATGMQYTGTHHGFVMPTETLNMPLSTLDDFDFGRHPSVDMSDMDFENESPSDSLPTMFYPSSSSSSSGQFVDPTALIGQEDSPADAAPARRMYPGMHTQQAAQAKAQQAQRQQEMARQQQQRQISGQKPLPTQSKPQQKDPHVEESISRLLHQMRQNSVTSADDDASTPTGNMPNVLRLKKEEEEMDEDERLLASEEGKKLSSKERRQLRNKVSARAFRSRRKEYIGQLEGEVAVKVQEANDLRVQNRQLMEENTRLSDLTRMLLSSQAFSGFLNELSQNGMPAPSTAALAVSQPQPQPTKKDVNPHQATRQAQNQQTQVGMTIIPESTLDFSMLESIPTSNWNAGLGMNSYQVCAVMEIPEGPAIDIDSLSGKKSHDVTVSSTSAVKDYPVLQFPPVSKQQAFSLPNTTVNEEAELNDVAFTLFVDQPALSPLAVVGQRLKCDLPSSHTLSSAQSTAEASEPEEDRWATLENMCSTLDASFENLSLHTSHIS